MSENSNHMSPEEFRRNGYAVIEWIARYMEEVGEYPVMSRVSPGEILDALPAAAPDHGSKDVLPILKDMDEIILPGITHWASPKFFAYFPSNASPPAILGDLMSSGLGVQGMLWVTSPAATELEIRMMDWLATLLQLPKRFHSGGNGGGVIQDSASSSVLCAILAARERVTQGQSNREGLSGTQPLTAYSSTEAHSSIEKGLRIAGIGSQGLRKVGVDEQFSIDLVALRAQIEADIAAGFRPFFVSATLGSTSSGAFDSVVGLGALCQEYDLWLHVDAAMFGTAAACPEYRWIHEGLELADSYCFNPHKWMLTNFDCCAFWVADRKDLIGALGIHPDYLQNRATDSGDVTDYRDWQIPLGRRFRALKLWFVLRTYGVEGIQRVVREHVGLTQMFAELVCAAPAFELCAPHPFNLVCFRLRGGDTENRQLMEALNDSGALYLSHTTLNDQFVLRFCVGQWATEECHVQEAWTRICEFAASVQSTAS